MERSPAGVCTLTFAYFRMVSRRKQVTVVTIQSQRGSSDLTPQASRFLRDRPFRIQLSRLPNKATGMATEITNVSIPFWQRRNRIPIKKPEMVFLGFPLLPPH